MCIYFPLFEKLKQKREKSIFHSLFHFPDSFNSQGWAKINLEAPSPSRSPKWVTVTQALVAPKTNERETGLEAEHHKQWLSTPVPQHLPRPSPCLSWGYPCSHHVTLRERKPSSWSDSSHSCLTTILSFECDCQVVFSHRIYRFDRARCLFSKKV